MICSIILIISVFNLSGEKVCDLNEVMRLEKLLVENDRAYLAEEFKIHIYSLDKKKHISSFGKKGEGPGEFLYRSNTHIGTKEISIDTNNKILFFSKNGKFIRELRKNFTLFRMIPVGQNYINHSLDFDAKDINKALVYNVVGTNFKKIKDICNDSHSGLLIKEIRKGGRYNWPVPRIRPILAVYKDKIFMGDPEKNISIKVFDPMGNLKRTINSEYKRIKTTAEFKEHFMDEQKKDKNWERTKARKKFVFRNFFPAYEWFLVKNDLIYLFTHIKTGDHRECLIINMDGKLIKKTKVKFLDKEMIDISGEFFYYVIENEDEEIWELHRQKI